jgi:cell volume regulation protein A
MDSVSIFLLAIAGIFVVGIVGELVFARTGIPDVIWLITVGLIVGATLDKSGLAKIAPYFGAVTLVIVLFDGGTEIRLKELRTSAGRAGLLAALSFVLSMAVVAPIIKFFVYLGVLPASWGWTHCFMIGTILGGSSSVVIMPALRVAALAPRLANVINLESALTDVLCVVATGALIGVLEAKAGGSNPVIELGRSFGIGIVLGVVAGISSLLVLRILRHTPYAYPLILGSLFGLYALITEVGGSAALGILTVAVIIGNSRDISSAIGLERSSTLAPTVTRTHDQFAFIVKSSFSSSSARCCRRRGA